MSGSGSGIRHSRFRLSMLLVLLILPARCSAAAESVEQDEAAQKIPIIAWHIDLGQAFTSARERGQPVLLLLEQPDQTWSRQLLDAFSDPSVLPQMQEFVPVRLNIHLQTRLLDELLVREVPDLRIFTPEGHQLVQSGGTLKPAALSAFLAKAKDAKPDKGAPTLASLFPSVDVEALRSLEAKDKVPDAKAFARLLDMAGGRMGESRAEAQRLLRVWAKPMASALVEALAQPTLRPRLTAFDALAALDAPMGSYDPWKAPANQELVKKLEPWAQKMASAEPATSEQEKKHGSVGFEFPALPEHLRKKVEVDLALLVGEDAARGRSAWERLMAVGPALVPILRTRSREAVAHHPAQSVLLDRLRYRLLLPAEAIRCQPGVDERVANGSPGARAVALEQLMRSDLPGLETLVQEAACDPEPLVRETAIRNIAYVIEEPASILRDAISDPERNVRVAALLQMAKNGSAENAKVLTAYLGKEDHVDMISYAARALGAVKSRSSKEVLRGLLKNRRWEVRGEAAKALGEMADTGSIEALGALLEDEDGYVAARAVEALSKMGDESVVPAMAKAVEKHPSTTLAVLKALKRYPLRKAKPTDALLRKFTKHESPEIRAQALSSLANDSARPAFEEVAAGLKDESVLVRTAAAEGLRELITREALQKYIEEKKVPEAYQEVRERVRAMTKDPDDRLRMQAATTLAYFGDWADGRAVLLNFTGHADAHLRAEAYEAMAYLPGQEALAMVRQRLAATKPVLEDEEISRMLRGVASGEKTAAADWAPEQPSVEAYFALLEKVEKKHLGAWCQLFFGMATDENREYDKPVEKRHLEALAALLEKRMSNMAQDDRHTALRVVWFNAATLDEQVLTGHFSDPRLEVRRAAYRHRIAAEDLGPDNVARTLLESKEPELRRLGVAACIPKDWRRYVDDPTAYALIGGEKVYLDRERRYRSYSSDDSIRAPKVLELPLEKLEALLKDPDAEVRTGIAFLMAMEGGDQGLGLLFKRWKSDSNAREAGEAMVRAVVLAWYDDLTPYLSQIFDQMDREEDEWEIRRLYGQIKNLRGAKIAKLRNRIRSKYDVN